MCNYCDLSEYVGDKFKFFKFVDGNEQFFEAYILDSPEDECKVLQIDGVYTDLRIEIKHCPMCGKKL